MLQWIFFFYVFVQLSKEEKERIRRSLEDEEKGNREQKQKVLPALHLQGSKKSYTLVHKYGNSKVKTSTFLSIFLVKDSLESWNNDRKYGCFRKETHFKIQGNLNLNGNHLCCRIVSMGQTVWNLSVHLSTWTTQRLWLLEPDCGTPPWSRCRHFHHILYYPSTTVFVSAREIDFIIVDPGVRAPITSCWF